MGLSLAYSWSFGVVFVLMTGLWVASLMLKDASIVDRFWGFGYVLIAWTLAALATDLSTTQILLTTIVSVWGLRLSIYIHMRNKGHPEDYRYREMREHHGKSFWWYSYISVFLLQGGLMLIVAAPVILRLSVPEDSGSEISLFAVAGFLVWLTGFIFESGGDWQLSQFKKDPANKGKLLTTGLWSVTRHPNYFGDACQWWGFGIFAWSEGWLGYATFIGPIVMTLFIRKVSGVDLLEKNMKGKKPGFEEYMKRVPPFFPKLSLFWKSALVLISLGIGAAPNEAADYKNELPFSKISFTVKDLKTSKEIAWGEETISYQGNEITKATLYYPPGSERKVIQEETSTVSLETLSPSNYLFSNKLTGEKATLTLKDGKAKITYQPSEKGELKSKEISWTKQTIIGKTLHHYIVRRWDEIQKKTVPDFDLLVPMNMDSFGFRSRLSRTNETGGVKTYVIALEPASWAIRAFVPQMDFNYQVIDGTPRLVSYEGATTITIDGDDKRLVRIDFTYVPIDRASP